ncbi:hypothetical protein MNBD_GAMMA22-1302 [hydrothermal vent metagenome]|uniref:Uncharacterized protein n=1 Tax=hydrothermal vent metagenome TaxID=652676 RepID=A0A3B0ZS27_9ZZZZ
MTLYAVLHRMFKWLLIVSSLLFVYGYFTKDILPNADYYDLSQLNEPIQTATNTEDFSVEVNDQTYIIKPKFDYTLEGVIVSYHDADAFIDISHHDKWKDFINLRDLCVVWGDNVSTGIYKNMDFSNDSWTCWASWPDRETGRIFSMTQLSNNHILSHQDDINGRLMQSKPGDHIRLSGYLAEYSNPSNGFNRGTSTNRNDTGNGACETIYLNEFEIIKQANPTIRQIYAISIWLLFISLMGYIVTFFKAPTMFKN